MYRSLTSLVAYIGSTITVNVDNISFLSFQDYKEKPDYGRCVSIVASASLREMIKPGLLAIISPIAVGNSLLSSPYLL